MNKRRVSLLHKDLIYRNTAYISGLALIFGLFISFRDQQVQVIVDFIFALITLNTVVFAFLWLKNAVLLIGYFLYLVSFNFELLFNPLFTSQAYSGSTTFLLQLDLVAFGIVLVGIFADKYLTGKVRLSLAPMLLITFIGTAVFQLLVRNYG